MDNSNNESKNMSTRADECNNEPASENSVEVREDLKTEEKIIDTNDKSLFDLIEKTDQNNIGDTKEENENNEIYQRTRQKPNSAKSGVRFKEDGEISHIRIIRMGSAASSGSRFTRYRRLFSSSTNRSSSNGYKYRGSEDLENSDNVKFDKDRHRVFLRQLHLSLSKRQ